MQVLALRAGAATLRLLPEAGGRITACTLVGTDGMPLPVLQPYPEDRWDPDQWAKGGVYPLIPYSGRVRDALLRFDGRDWPLAPHPGSPHTLHGIAQRRPWQLCEHGADHARMVYRHAPDAHWPWPFEAEQRVRLAPTRLKIDITLRNTGSGAMPAGVGLHPFLPVQHSDKVGFEAGPAWPLDRDCLALPPPPGVEVQKSHELGTVLATSREFTCCHAGWRGALRVLNPDGTARMWLRGAGALDQLVLHRPAGGPYLCVEPVSHVPDGFNLQTQQVSATGARSLAAGDALSGGMSIDTAPGTPAI